MPWIVVLASDERLAQDLRVGLTEDGWQVETARTRDEAEGAVERLAAQLVVADGGTAGAAELLRAMARANQGPGAVALVDTAGALAEGAADAELPKPIDGNELRLVVRRLVTEGRAPRSPRPAAASEQLTSQDLFGDMLAEVEGEPAAPPAARSAPAAPERRPAVDDAIEQTLSGLLAADEPARPAAPKRREAGVDDLLSKTLSGLAVGDRPRKPAPPAAAKPAASAAPPPAAATPPAKGTPPKKAKPPAPGVDRLLEDVRTPTPERRSRRPSQELDFSSLDALARPARAGREKTPTAADALATQKVPVPAALRPGTGPVEFGQYTLLERIALGGMAEVWKARMKGVEGFQKTVAIKKILPHLTDSTDFVTMFIDEAKLAAQLNHNHIIHIYDLGKIGDDYYIAMEYVEGKDLRSILNAAREQQRPVPLGLALLVASRLAAALDHAHNKKDFEGRELGLVHRDVSPQNVLISYDGDIKLCDFGIVKAVSKASKTQMGALKGKLQYMSPEQAWGRPVDARSDLFSLGSLLFEMLTGRRLFVGESEMSVLDAVREGRIQAPRDLDPRVPLEVNALVLHTLARDPDDRIQSAGELQRQLDSILSSLRPSPSQRELASYVRGLFGDASEATLASAAAAVETPAATPAAVAAPAVAPSPAPAADMATAPPVAGATGDRALELAPGGSRNLLWVGIAAAIVALVVYLLVSRGGGTNEVPPPATAETSTPSETAASEAPAAEGAPIAPGEQQNLPPRADAPAADAPAATAAPAAADVAQLVDAEVKKREEQLRQKLDAELAKKKQEVATATEKPAPSKPEPAAAGKPAATTTKSEPSAAESAAATSPKPAEPAAAEPQAATPVPAPVPAAPATSPRTNAIPPAPAPAKPAAPRVREGDLVQPGPDVTAPVLVSVDKPEYPPIARRMRVEGTVVLSLLVDENGRVIDVRLERGVSQNVGINEAAVAAARSARFRPATQDGVRVKVWHQLTIPFKL